MDQQTLIELSKLTERLVEDRFYELALSEIEENSFDTVAKAKAFEEAEGEEKKSRAFYVKHRVRRMKDELAAFILNEAEKQKSQNELDRKQAAIAADKAKQLALEGERLLRLAYLTKQREDKRFWFGLFDVVFLFFFVVIPVIIVFVVIPVIIVIVS